jgi:hypothetical protein
MNPNRSLKSALCVGLLGVTAAQAQLFYHVDVNTAALGGSPSAPFALDFQLIDGGSASANNTAILSNFTFGGGGATGSANLTGGAVGSLGSTVTLSDASSSFNEFYQTFNHGTSLSFDVSLTRNQESGNLDGFSFSILDKDLANITTTGPGDSLLYASFNSTLGITDIVASSGTGAYSGITVTAVPEPAETGTYCALALVGAAMALRRFRQK